MPPADPGTATDLPAGLYLSTPLVSVDAAGGSPALGTITEPAGWGGAKALILRYAARLSTTGIPTWHPSGTSTFTTADDPGAVGSVLDGDSTHTAVGDVTGSGMLASGSPSASAFLGLLAVHSDGSLLRPATFAVAGVIEVTGHPYFRTLSAPAGSTWLHVAVTLSGTPPVITDGNGFTWDTLVQQPMGTGYLTVWVAKITRDTTNGAEHVFTSETIDSSIGIRLAGQTP